MTLWLLFAVLSYLLGGSAIGWFFWWSLREPRPPRFRPLGLLPGLEEDDLTLYTDTWGLY